MSIKRFKFVSPGVFINEIDNSFRPESATAIGPVVVGRASRGPGMRPIKVQSYSEFVEVFGSTVPGAGKGDVSRNGNYQSPMYGTYAAKAFLRANIAPLTYIRLLGTQTIAGKAAAGEAAAGWQTTNDADSSKDNAITTLGGAYGLWVWESGSSSTQSATASLGAIIYCQNGAPLLSGSIYGGRSVSGSTANGAPNYGGDDSLKYMDIWTCYSTTASMGAPIVADSAGNFHVQVQTSNATTNASVNFDDSSANFIRKKLNTNPQLKSSQNFYPSAVEKDYWLGESFEQDLRDDGLATKTNLVGIIYPIASSGSATTSPAHMKGQAYRDAIAGWFIGQDRGPQASFYPQNMQKLFRLVGLSHGDWLRKNCKVSITRLRQSNTTSNPYGSFSIVIRDLRDTDSKVVILERFDNLNLDPSSPNFVARRIGDQYVNWDNVSKRLKTYGEYANKSKYMRAEMNADVEAGATDASLLPFGYWGPPKPTTVTGLQVEPWVEDQQIDQAKAASCTLAQKNGQDPTAGRFIFARRDQAGCPRAISYSQTASAGGAFPDFSASVFITGTGVDLDLALSWPQVRLRTYASNGKLTNPTNAYFGITSTRATGSTSVGTGIADPQMLLYANYPDDPVGTQATDSQAAYVFSMDDIVSGSDGRYYWGSGSRQTETSGLVTSASYTDLLDANYNQFTAPFWGGSEGFDITKPDPMYNQGMDASSTEDNSYAYHTYRRAIDTVANPDFIDMNLLAVPGLTLDSLTTHMIRLCEERGDVMSLVDLPNVYIPSAERYYANKADRLGTTPVQAANALKDRRIDSSYGAAFYPWVQTRDEDTGALVWIPPTVAMMGVLASSEAKSNAVWFAPAGFNRGGLTEGAAGIPVTNVSERLNSKERDTLYDGRINPIASFPSSGIVVFGQKTLQERASALDRINVRRLVIFMKKQISILSTQVLFEQNVPATWTRFKGLVEPFLQNTMTNYGIVDYRLILDETTTTPDLIDQNIMYAKIMVKPARAIEYIAIDFVITSTGASFED
jgi:hypothetical protein